MGPTGKPGNPQDKDGQGQEAMPDTSSEAGGTGWTSRHTNEVVSVRFPVMGGRLVLAAAKSATEARQGVWAETRP